MSDSNSVDLTQINLEIAAKNRKAGIAVRRSWNIKVPSVEERTAVVQERQESKFTVTRRSIPMTGIEVQNPAALRRDEQERLKAAQSAVKVRDASNPEDMKPRDYGKKREAAIRPPELGMRGAILRTVGPTVLLNLPNRQTEQIDTLPSLPKVLAEEHKTSANLAFEATIGGQSGINIRTNILNDKAKVGVWMALPGAAQSKTVSHHHVGPSRVDVRVEGVRVGTVGPKDKMRQDDPMVPTWYLYDGDSLILHPSHFNARPPAGFTLERRRAALVSQMILDGTITHAIFALPKKDDEEQGQQWKHVAKLGTILHVNSNGKAMPTRETVGFHAKPSKDDGANYQVIYTMMTDEGRFSSEAWFHSETRAHRGAMDLLELGALKVTIICGVSDSEGANKGLDSTRYPLTAGTTEKGQLIPAWQFDGITATLTRSGYAALMPTPEGDEFIPSRKRGPVMTRPANYNRGTTWQKAKNDTCSFSRG